jgi:hypothetical protein
MGVRMDPLFCPSCGDVDFYSSAPLPTGSSRWVVDTEGRVAVAQGTGDLTVVTMLDDEVFCAGCHSLVTGTVVARARVE